MSSLYRSFHDRVNDSDKQQKLITCQICCIEKVPSHSKNSSICEMCFEDDFWDTMEELKKDKTDMLWALKTISEGLLCESYFSIGSYLGQIAYPRAVDGLGQSHLFQTKDEAESWMDRDLRAWVEIEERGKGPAFKIVQITLSEVD